MTGVDRGFVVVRKKKKSGVGKMKRFSIQEPCCHCAVLIPLLHATLSKEVSGDTLNRSASLSLNKPSFCFPP